MAQLPEVIDPYAPITKDEAGSVLSTGLYSDDPALRLVVMDALRAENAEASKAWVMQWTTASSIYQSPHVDRYWEGTMVPKASVPFFTVATAVNSLVPQIIAGLYYENPPFMIQERPGTTSQAARAVQALIGYQLDEINFREELRLGCVNAVLFGTGIWKWGWETFTQERKIYKRKATPIVIKNPLAIPGAEDIRIESDDDLEEEIVEEYIDRPVFENITNLRYVLVDPALNRPDIRKGKFVIHRMYMTVDDLDRLRLRPGFKIPSKSKLLDLFFAPKENVDEAGSEIGNSSPMWDAKADPRFSTSTDDPFAQPLEVLERWTDKTYIVILQKKLVLCNDENPYGVIPFSSVGWWDVPEAFWSMGLAKTIGPEQRLQQGITNTWLDQAALNLNGVYVRVLGTNMPTQNIRISPGKIVNVQDKDGFKPLERLPAVPEAAEHISMSQARAEVVSGSSDASSQGVAGSSGHSNLARSATGANMLASGSSSRVGDFVEKLANQVMVPFLSQVHEMNRAMLPPSTMRYILGEELEHEFMRDSGDLIELLNAKVKFSILAAAKMQARKNMAQALPLLVQFLNSPETSSQLAIGGKKIETQEIIRMMFEVSDWKNLNDVVVQMTPEDQQRWQAMQASAQQNSKTAGAQQLEDQKFQHQQQLSDQENTARAAREVLRQAFQKSALPSVLSGTPSATTGFGSAS